MAALPPRRNPTPTRISKQNLSPLQILLQMGFPKQRAEKALAATGNRGVQLASDWLLAHVNDPLLDDNSPREYILYACPTGPFLEQLQKFWEKSRRLCSWNGAHNFTPHITLVSFFKAPDEDAPHLAQSLKAVMERQGAMLNEALKLETYTSPNFMGFFVAEEHADYLKRIAMQYVKEVSNATISLEPHVKSLHLTLAYQFPSVHYSQLKSLVDELDPTESNGWELRLYSRDPRVNGKQVHKVVHPYTPTEFDELDLRTGDYVYLSSEALANSPDGWVEGTSWLTGLTGLLPDSYTERTAESEAWTLHKKVALNHLADKAEVKRTSSQKSQQTEMNRADDAEKLSVKEETVKNGSSDDGTKQSNSVSGNKDIPAKEFLIKHEDIENIYENLQQQDAEDSVSDDEASRKLFLMRHGERIDFTFGIWVPYCFDESGTYMQKDLNMPKNLPSRKNGPAGYIKDTPLTNMGLFQANMIGQALKDSNINIDQVYCSPSFRCIMTCDGVLQGCNKKNEVKIKVEPGLFEWLVWYYEGLPEWMGPHELVEAGYNIDTAYKPFVGESELRESSETCEQFYLRNAFVAREALTAHPGANVLLVGHAATLDVCSRELIGQKPRTPTEMTKLLQNVPYCSLLQLSHIKDKWEITELPFPPITHTGNKRFDYKNLLN